MNDFLKFLDDVVKDYPMHVNISYSKITDWGIHIWKKLDTKNVEIVMVQDPDLELVFAKAQVELKEWLLENNGGY